MNENMALERRRRRVDDMIACRTSDRIAIAPSLGFLPITLYGETTIQEAMEDWSQGFPSYRRYHEEYRPDLFYGPATSMWPTKILDILDCQYVKWPGKHFDDPNHGFQVLADGYMEASEYDEYADDPTGFMIGKILPRHFSRLKGLQAVNLSSPVYFGSVYGMIPFGLPIVKETLSYMTEAGDEMLKTVGANGAFSAQMEELGFPNGADYFGTIPFDVFNDTLRGMINASMDMLECPEALKRALDACTRIQVRNIKHAFETQTIKHVVFYVHNGTDVFMSPKQFEEFYWPGMKAVVNAVIECGGVPRIYTEGNYLQKLDFFKELPKGSAILNLIDTDLKKAKQKLGGHICLSGGIDGTLLQFGSPAQVIDNVKETLDIMAPGGGYILDCSVSLDQAKPENLRALFDTAREYGRY